MITKVAVDSAAKEYWKLLYGDFGEQLVRDIPRRIKAALVADNKVKNASADAGVIVPTAHVATDAGLMVEGMYRDASTKMMFLATVGKDGEVTGVKSFVLR